MYEVCVTKNSGRAGAMYVHTCCVVWLLAEDRDSAHRFGQLSMYPSPGVGPYLAVGIGPVDVWVIACL